MLSTVIYKMDVTGRLRTWQYELDGLGGYRTIAGLNEGVKVTSEWTMCRGNAQRPSAIDQAAFEAESMERHKLERTYHRGATDAVRLGAHFFEPMLAQKYKGVEFPAYAQPKPDGVRCIARAEGLFSRQGKRIVSCPHIEDSLAPLFKDDPDLILDGELYNHAFKDRFEDLISIIRKTKPSMLDIEQAAGVVQYHIYDVPSVQERFDGRWAMRPLIFSEFEKFKRLPLQYVDTFTIEHQEALDEHEAWCLKEGYEGQMVRLNGPYEQKRSKQLLKRKDFQDEEYTISRIIEGEGNWTGYAKVVEFILPDDKRLENGERPRATIKGNQSFCADILMRKDELVGTPVTVTFFHLTNQGIPRFPIATKFHVGEKL